MDFAKVLSRRDLRSFDAYENIKAGRYSKTDLTSLMWAQRKWAKIGWRLPMNKDSGYFALSLPKEWIKAMENKHDVKIEKIQ